jgi:hypothetical protein
VLQVDLLEDGVEGDIHNPIARTKLAVLVAV